MVAGATPAGVEDWSNILLPLHLTFQLFVEGEDGTFGRRMDVTCTTTAGHEVGGWTGVRQGDLGSWPCGIGSRRDISGLDLLDVAGTTTAGGDIGVVWVRVRLDDRVLLRHGS